MGVAAGDGAATRSRAAPVRRVGRDLARSTSRSRSPAGRSAARSWPATPSSSSRLATTPLVGRAAGRGAARGRPAGRRLQLVTGAGETVGAELWQQRRRRRHRLHRLATRSAADLYKHVRRGGYPQPVIVEMGGKNPAIVTATADLDKAAEGVMRSAFGFSGQKCSACSRVLRRARRSHDEFVELLVEKAEAITVGDPSQRENWLGPVINDAARSRRTSTRSPRRGATAGSLAGGERLTDGELGERLLRRADGRRRPAARPPAVHATSCSCRSSSSARGRLARRGARRWPTTPTRPDGRLLLARTQAEIEQFLDRIEAGVVYVNRARRRDDRRLARHPAVRRLEGLGLHRQGRRRPLLRPAVHARAVAHDSRVR